MKNGPGKRHKKTPAGKGGEEPAGEKEENVEQNANSLQQRLVLPICQRLSFAILIAKGMPMDFFISKKTTRTELQEDKTMHKRFRYPWGP